MHYQRQSINGYVRFEHMLFIEIIKFYYRLEHFTSVLVAMLFIFVLTLMFRVFGQIDDNAVHAVLSVCLIAQFLHFIVFGVIDYFLMVDYTDDE